ncbi:MAG: radical SAM protein [Petrotogales bacterium]
MRIYLLNPPYFPRFGREMRWQDTGRGGTLYYPVWLSYAAGKLEERHEIRLVDAPAWHWEMDEVIRDLGNFKPELVVLETSFTSMDNDLKVGQELKQLDVPIVMVGPPASQFAEKMLEVVDVVARYEYDFILAELADKMEKEEDIGSVKGISYRRNDELLHNEDRTFSTSGDLDSLPFVSKVYYKHLNLHHYFLNYSLYPMVQIFAGRGCPNKCTFCSWPQSFMGRKYRIRSVENILNEFEWIEKNLNVKEIFLEDDTFTISKKKVMEFCKGYQDRGLSISWSCNARVDTLDEETMQEMRKANCRFLIVGFESANEDILKNIRKGATVEQAREFVRNVKKAGLFLHADFIIGLPGETKETIEETRKFIKEIKPEQLQVSVCSPFPGTELYEWCRENGYLLTDDPNEYLDDQGHQKAIISYPQLSNEEMVKKVDEILKDYYMSLNYVPLALRQVLRKNGFDEFKRLWRSVKMFYGYIKSR